ncbi:cysteine and histidine-rich domain-containing protein 1-like [Rhopilema esculentum]|uniref:cysteine and histidine-rich domain-containing protein 1-like n=1 Tax=Rhopilema esculentum TaxID=499914 RepID=UPI0031D98A26|eukprot:gene17186-8724_t
MDSDSLVCYNRGCGKRFKEDENVEGSCQYHPGAPVFHEGYKSWGCCKKKSTDFTEFLNMPGCTKGFHNKDKPEQPVKKVDAPLEVGEVIEHGTKQMQQSRTTMSEERPSDDLPRIRLKAIVSSSLKSALQRYHEQQQQRKEQLGNENNEDAVLPGASCKHNGCNMTFVDETSNKELCEYHPGFPIFHEGYKYWTCCKKRTSDFSEFLKQVGCKKGSHEWMKPSEEAQKKSACRYDWHQTGPFVYISIYAKTTDPEKSYIEVNPTKLHAFIAFNGGTNIFELELTLNGVIEPEASKVEFLGTKVEIKLKKKSAFAWRDLEYKSRDVNKS